MALVRAVGVALLVTLIGHVRRQIQCPLRQVVVHGAKRTFMTRGKTLYQKNGDHPSSDQPKQATNQGGVFG